MVLEGGNIHGERRFKGSFVLTGHPFLSQPGNGISYNVMMFEGSSELFHEVIKSAHRNGSSSDGLLSEGSSPDLGCSFGHVGEGKGDFLGTGVVYCIIDFEIEKDSQEPGCGFRVGSVKVFWGGNTKFIGFGGHGGCWG